MVAEDSGARLRSHLRSIDDLSEEQVAALRDVLVERDLAVIDEHQYELDLDLNIEAPDNGGQAEFPQASLDRLPKQPPTVIALGDDRSLVYRLTRAGPARAKDPPSLWWLPWVALEFPLHVARRIKAAMSSGGEARGQARLRSHMLNTAATLMLALILGALVYWGAQLLFDPAPVISPLVDLGSTVADSVRELWAAAPTVMKIVLGLLLTSVPGAVAVVKLHLRRPAQSRA